VLRVARATNDLERIGAMYGAGLGLDVLGRFRGHSGFDGIILGRPGGAYHLEFTAHAGSKAPASPSEDDLLVFYEPDAERWRGRVGAMEGAGFRRVASFNPYWDERGATFEDPEGYRVVIENAAWG
jgi:hypothetical protein